MPVHDGTSLKVGMRKVNDAEIFLAEWQVSSSRHHQQYLRAPLNQFPFLCNLAIRPVPPIGPALTCDGFRSLDLFR